MLFAVFDLLIHLIQYLESSVPRTKHREILYSEGFLFSCQIEPEGVAFSPGPFADQNTVCHKPVYGGHGLRPIEL